MELKFKVWNKKDKQMIDWFTLTQNAWNTFRGDTPLSLLYDVLVARKDDFEKLLFIGLNDKNGKDVFEGDIILDDSGNKQIVVFGKIGYDGSWNGLTGFGFKNWIDTESDFMDLFYHNDPDKIEVIGNIYENLELL